MVLPYSTAKLTGEGRRHQSSAACARPHIYGGENAPSIWLAFVFCERQQNSRERRNPKGLLATRDRQVVQRANKRNTFTLFNTLVRLPLSIHTMPFGEKH